MRCRKRIWTTSLTLLAPLTMAGCASPSKIPPTDSFCALHVKTITSPADATAIKTLPTNVQRPIVSNETLYRCICEKWQNPVCAKVQQ